VAERTDCSVADSYGTLDLVNLGYTLLFEAQWLGLPAVPQTDARTTTLWSVVTSADQLGAWCNLHDYAGVLTNGVLRHPRLTILASHEGAQMVAGAVLNDAGTSVGLSNVWSVDGGAYAIEGVLIEAHRLYPGRAITAYAAGDELTSLTDLGFVPLGPHRVWLRNEGPRNP
jgi:hypothetical protein